MRKSVVVVLLFGLTLGAALPMMAPDTAEAISLPRKMTDGRTCRMLLGKPHLHTGRSRPKATKEIAYQAAIVRWSRFTVWEYGPNWGDFHLAARRYSACAAAKGGGWICKVEAQPCRI